MVWSLAISPIEWIVLPPILRTRSARSSARGENLRRLVIEQQMIIAEMRPRDVPVEILGLDVKGIGIGQQPVQRPGDLRSGVAR